MAQDQTELEILELTHEDAYGCWEFWRYQPKTPQGAKNIATILAKLVAENKIVALKHNSKENSYTEVMLNIDELNAQLLEALKTITDESGTIDRDNFYWFEATDARWRIMKEKYAGKVLGMRGNIKINVNDFIGSGLLKEFLTEVYQDQSQLTQDGIYYLSDFYTLEGLSRWLVSLGGIGEMKSQAEIQNWLESLLKV